MLNFPISQNTFKRSFLDGDGDVEISTDKDAWLDLVRSDKPFDKNVDRIADVKFGVNRTKPLILGGNNTVKMGISVGIEAVHQIHLIWPDSPVDPTTIHGVKPRDGQLLVRLLMQARADASVDGSAPVGPLKSTFGVTAGGSFGYERLVTYPDSKPAREILSDTFARLRLPQQIDAPNEIPEVGEVIVTHFGGYLTVRGQVSYGFSMTGTREIEVGKLNLDLDYRLKLAAGVSVGFKLAGEFELEASRGKSPNFVRYVVRKSRQSEFNFAADFGFDAEVHLKGLPNTSDEFLAKAFGADVEAVLKLFNKARKFSKIDELEKSVGKLAKGTVHDLSMTLIGKALDNTTVSEFVDKMLQVADTYNNIDARIAHLYADFLGKIPELRDTLDLLTRVASRDGLKEITDNKSWELINRLAGDRLYNILLEEPAFVEFTKLIKDTRSFIDEGAMKEVRDVIAKVKADFPADGLIQQLKGITTQDQLKDLADEKLQGLVEKLLNKTFDEIKHSDVGDTLKEIHNTLEKVATFKDTYFKKAKEAANRSYSAQLHFGYSRASSSDALLDVEVDVSTDAGRELARLASGGDFKELLGQYQSKLVKINKGVFTHSVMSSTQLQVNLFGFGIEGMTRVIQNAEEALETHEGGLLHIYTTKTQIEERHKHGGELTASTFLFATVAQALQPEGSKKYLIQTLPKMSVQYDFLKEDNKTKPDELRQILDLAQELGIVNTAQYTDQLRKEFPNGLGKVTAKYVVRYDNDAVAAAFQINDGPNRENLQRIARDMMRTVISAKYTAMPQTSHMALLGFAYRDPRIFETFNNLGFAAFGNSHVSVTLPASFTQGASQVVELPAVPKASLITLYNVEGNFVKRLVKLDATIDRLRDDDHTDGISAEDLNKEVKRFVEMADDLNFGRENAFFIVFDRLILQGTGGKASRNSALVLEITPPGGEKVTKVMTAAKPKPLPMSFADEGEGAAATA